MLIPLNGEPSHLKAAVVEGVELQAVEQEGQQNRIHKQIKNAEGSREV